MLLTEARPSMDMQDFRDMTPLKRVFLQTLATLSTQPHFENMTPDEVLAGEVKKAQDVFDNELRRNLEDG